jgi:hypothetical protein
MFMVPEKTVYDRSHLPFYSRFSSGYPGLTQVCQLLRLEFLSFLLRKVELSVDMKSMTKYTMPYDRKLKDCQATLIVFWEESTTCTDTATELLPLLLLPINMPRLEIWIETDFGVCSDLPNRDELQNVAKLLKLARQNIAWRGYLVHAVESVTFHNPQNRCHHVDEGGRRHDARLHITFEKEHRELWMDGTHEFAQLRELMAETGLDSLTALDVRVGLTFLGNQGLGKGLRTEEEQQAIDWMLGRSKTRPSDVQRLPRMLQELGE